jgi:hypothetical protein
VSLHFVTNSANSHFPNQMKDPESINTSFAWLFYLCLSILLLMSGYWIEIWFPGKEKKIKTFWSHLLLKHICPNTSSITEYVILGHLVVRWLRPVSVEGVTGEFSRVTHHLYCIGLWDDTPSLNEQGRSIVS